MGAGLLPGGWLRALPRECSGPPGKAGPLCIARVCVDLACCGGGCGGSVCRVWASAFTKASCSCCRGRDGNFLLITRWLLPALPGDTVGTRPQPSGCASPAKGVCRGLSPARAWCRDGPGLPCGASHGAVLQILALTSAGLPGTGISSPPSAQPSRSCQDPLLPPGVVSGSGHVQCPWGWAGNLLRHWLESPPCPSPGGHHLSSTPPARLAPCRRPPPGRPRAERPPAPRPPPRSRCFQGDLGLPEAALPQKWAAIPCRGAAGPAHVRGSGPRFWGAVRPRERFLGGCCVHGKTKGGASSVRAASPDTMPDTPL